LVWVPELVSGWASALVLEPASVSASVSGLASVWAPALVLVLEPRLDSV
jgi:hypothetical protein